MLERGFSYIENYFFISVLNFQLKFVGRVVTVFTKKKKNDFFFKKRI